MRFEKGWHVVALILQMTVVFVFISMVSGCAPGEKKNSSFKDKTLSLQVAAASDLRFAFQELGEWYQEQTGKEVVFQFGSSGNFAHQIAQGAPFDLFASANSQYIDTLVESGHIMEDSRAVYGIGRIVIVTNGNLGISFGMEDLLSPEIQRIAMANPAHAPYGMAAREALENAGIWDGIRPRLVYGENVSQAMQFVETGNAQVGLVALSVAINGQDPFQLVDQNLHSPLVQTLGIVSGSSHKEQARVFIDTLLAEEGQAIMKKYGFQMFQEPEEES